MTADSPVKKKKAKRDKQTSLLAYKNNPAQLNQVLSSSYVGKRCFSLRRHSMDAASLLGRKRCCSSTTLVLWTATTRRPSLSTTISASKMAITCFNHILTNKIQPSQTRTSPPLQRITSAFWNILAVARRSSTMPRRPERRRKRQQPHKIYLTSPTLRLRLSRRSHSMTSLYMTLNLLVRCKIMWSSKDLMQEKLSKSKNGVSACFF